VELEIPAPGTRPPAPAVSRTWLALQVQKNLDDGLYSDEEHDKSVHRWFTCSFPPSAHASG
jgi:hypothetical protein